MPEIPHIPPIDGALVKWLETVIPPYDPKPSDTLPEIMFRAGQREIVVKLRTALERQIKKEDL